MVEIVFFYKSDETFRMKYDGSIDHKINFRSVPECPEPRGDGGVFEMEVAFLYIGFGLSTKNPIFCMTFNKMDFRDYLQKMHKILFWL